MSTSTFASPWTSYTTQTQFTLDASWSFWIMYTSKHFTWLVSSGVLDCFTCWLSPFTTISCEWCRNLDAFRFFLHLEDINNKEMKSVSNAFFRTLFSMKTVQCMAKNNNNQFVKCLILRLLTSSLQEKYMWPGKKYMWPGKKYMWPHTYMYMYLMCYCKCIQKTAWYK